MHPLAFDFGKVDVRGEGKTFKGRLKYSHTNTGQNPFFLKCKNRCSLAPTCKASTYDRERHHKTQFSKIAQIDEILEILKQKYKNILIRNILLRQILYQNSLMPVRNSVNGPFYLWNNAAEVQEV